MDNKLRMFTEEYENEKTGKKVEGITILIDGQIQEMFDALEKKRGKDEGYLELMKEVIFAGVEKLIQ